MIRRPTRSTQRSSSAASDVYKRQVHIVAQNKDVEAVILAVSRLEAGRGWEVMVNTPSTGARLVPEVEYSTGEGS